MQVDEEGVLHVTRGVLLGEVQRGEHVPVVLHVGTGDGGEADILEDAAHLVHHDGDGVHGAHFDIVRGACHVGNLLPRARLHLADFPEGVEPFCRGILQLVDDLSEGLALFRLHVFQLRKQGLYFALLGQELKAELFQGLRILNLEGFDFLAYFFYGFHIVFLDLPPWYGGATCYSMIFALMILMSSRGRSLPSFACAAILSTTSMPETTSPKTV